MNKLLQLLGGVDSPSGVIFILTTNYKDKLDKALYRPGRINLNICLSKISKELAIDMVNSFNLDPDVILKGEKFPINPSYLQNKIINYIN